MNLARNCLSQFKAVKFILRLTCAYLVSTINCFPGDFITEWNQAMIAALRTETTPPPLAARNLAILHLAIYDSINSVQTEYHPYLPDLPQPPPLNPTSLSLEAAALGAAYHVSVGLFPSRKAAFDALRKNTFKKLNPAADYQPAIDLGKLVATIYLESRAADGSAAHVPYVPSTTPGAWRRTLPYFRPPESPHWARVKPFALTNANQFRPAGPPSLKSREWTEDFNLTRILGAKNSPTRTPEQTEIAKFWSDFSYTSTPPGHWNEIAAQVANQRKLSLPQSARLFAMLNVALADAAIACWEAKFTYNYWRPVTAIREAERDGNPDTLPESQWLPLLTTPGFPEYISGHSTFSGAAAEILVSCFGTDDVTFTIGSDGLPGITRTYHSFRKTAEEIGMSRIHGGIHFPSANRDGLELGRKIAAHVSANYFQPVKRTVADKD